MLSLHCCSADRLGNHDITSSLSYNLGSILSLAVKAARTFSISSPKEKRSK